MTEKLQARVPVHVDRTVRYLGFSVVVMLLAIIALQLDNRSTQGDIQGSINLLVPPAKIQTGRSAASPLRRASSRRVSGGRRGRQQQQDTGQSEGTTTTTPAETTPPSTTSRPGLGAALGQAIDNTLQTTCSATSSQQQPGLCLN